MRYAGCPNRRSLSLNDVFPLDGEGGRCKNDGTSNYMHDENDAPDAHEIPTSTPTNLEAIDETRLAVGSVGKWLVGGGNVSGASWGWIFCCRKGWARCWCC